MCVYGVDTEKKVTIGLVWFGLVQVSRVGRRGERRERKKERERVSKKGKRSNTPKKTKRKRIQSHFFFQKNFSCQQKKERKKAFVCLFFFSLSSTKSYTNIIYSIKNKRKQKKNARKEGKGERVNFFKKTIFLLSFFQETKRKRKQK